MDSHDKKDVKIFREEDFANGKTPEKEVRIRWKNSDFISSLEFALSGIVTAVKRERNMRKHLLSAAGVIVAGLVFQVSMIDWLFLLLAVMLVIVGELLNSAIEEVVDLAANYQFHMRAKRAKDMAAGAVLLLSGFAVIVGCFVFIPKIWALAVHFIK